jgi:23S rRNA (adenine2503-C2)-methyltransferase
MKDASLEEAVLSFVKCLPRSILMPPLLDESRDAVLNWLKERGQPAMRLRQIMHWVLQGRADSFENMSDLPLQLRGELAATFAPFGTRIQRQLEARDGTHKLLLRLQDDHLIECVLLGEADRRTSCISTQVGCAMGCVFCASGLNGVARNLTRGEILEQVLRMRNLLPKDERLSHVVVMGMGEPLANLENLVSALDTICAADGLGIGARHITISSVGLPAKIRRLADLGKQYHLAISLHAPDDELRTRIVPTNSGTGLLEILHAADYFHQKTGRQVTYEYVLLRDLNDGPDHAQQLSRLLQGRSAHVNLIPFNEVSGLPYDRPDDLALAEFTRRLREAGISVKVRKRKGSEIDAACGQLRRTELQLAP